MMELPILALLSQDGITNGSIYALLALALVLVFTVTRVIWIPSGEFVAYGTLTLAQLELGHPPAILGLLAVLALVVGAMETYACVRRGEVRRLPLQLLLWTIAPLVLAGAAGGLARTSLPFGVQVALAVAVVTPLAPLLYRIAYQPLAEASVLVLLIVSVAVHLAMTGLGLWFFGAEGSRTQPFTTAAWAWGRVNVGGQSVLVALTSLVLIAGLYLFFGRTLYGKALRATALNRIGARLVGISPTFAGALTFTLAGALCAFSGVLIGPITTVYYDSGFLISLKGFVGAIIGGLVSYPVAAAGAMLVGMLEAFASFWASGFKEVIVFTLIIPVLLWRSLAAPSYEDDE